MKLSAQDFYLLFANHKLKAATDVIHDGFTGMYFVLKVLSDADGDISAGNISEVLNVTTARTAVLLSTLEKKGFITKSKSSEDARKTIVRITESGEAALEERRVLLFGMVDSLLGKLSKGEIKDLYKILQKLLTN